jgi:hypothetical protein
MIAPPIESDPVAQTTSITGSTAFISCHLDGKPLRCRPPEDGATPTPGQSDLAPPAQSGARSKIVMVKSQAIELREPLALLVSFPSKPSSATPSNLRVCCGSSLSRHQYVTDVEHLGYTDARKT